MLGSVGQCWAGQDRTGLDRAGQGKQGRQGRQAGRQAGRKSSEVVVESLHLIDKHQAERANWEWNGQSPPMVTHLLQQGQTSQSFPNLTNTWRQSIQKLFYRPFSFKLPQSLKKKKHKFCQLHQNFKTEKLYFVT